MFKWLRCGIINSKIPQNFRWLSMTTVVLLCSFALVFCLFVFVVGRAPFPKRTRGGRRELFHQKKEKKKKKALSK